MQRTVGVAYFFPGGGNLQKFAIYFVDETLQNSGECMAMSSPTKVVPNLAIKTGGNNNVLLVFLFVSLKLQIT